MARFKRILFIISFDIVLVFYFVSELLPLNASIAAMDDVFCVVPPGEPTGPFAACDAIFSSIQMAVDAAVGGEEVRVGAGVYKDMHLINGRYQVVYIDKNLTIQGGYTPPFSSAPDPLVHISTLDAQRLGRVIYVTGSISVTIEGLHLTGGLTRLEEPGSGLYASGGTILLQNNVIANNITIFGWGSGLYLTDTHTTLRGNNIHDNMGYGWNNGGGMAAEQSVITLQHNTISSNIASVEPNGEEIQDPVYGGGLYIADSQVSITDNLIYSNTALVGEAPGLSFIYSYGGGLSLIRSSGHLEANNIFDNLAGQWADGYGGGIYIEESNGLLLTRNFIHDNVGSFYNFGAGGGVAVYAMEDLTTSLTLHDNQIMKNIALTSGALGVGGGVALIVQQMTSITLTHNAILSNTALIAGDTGWGGGLISGGASRLYLNQNQVAGNVAAQSGDHGNGGGLYLVENEVFLGENVIRLNQASSTGGGLYMDGGQVRMENTAVLDNQGGLSGSGLYLTCGAQLNATHTTIARNVGNAIHLALTSDCEGQSLAPSTAVFTNTIFVSHTIGAVVSPNSTLALHGVLWHDALIAFQAEPGSHVTMTHQYAGDPLFVADGYHLTASSAARFKGLVTGVKTDIDGQGRPLINPALGADEYWLETHFLPIVRR